MKTVFNFTSENRDSLPHVCLTAIRLEIVKKKLFFLPKHIRLLCRQGVLPIEIVNCRFDYQNNSWEFRFSVVKTFLLTISDELKI